MIASTASNSSLFVNLFGAGVHLTSHGVILSWNPGGSDVIGYRVYRGTAPGTHDQLLNSTIQLTPNFADVTVAAGQAYFYVVTAVNVSNQESNTSSEIQATIPTP
jgi:fibronectin type 3 domain-containing protein